MYDTTRQHRKLIRIPRVTLMIQLSSKFFVLTTLLPCRPSWEFVILTVRTASTYLESSWFEQDTGERLRYSMDDPWFESRLGLFSETSRPALGPDTPPTQWVLGLFPGGKSSRGSKLTTHLHLVPRLSMCGAEPLLPYTPSWREGEKLLFYRVQRCVILCLVFAVFLKSSSE
jgi:hypothetical protein